jgi:CelD/BcsL family acetyltransferase involved in cellulose biosynthesis
VRVPGPFCPWLELPASWEELIGGVSGSLRSQVKRRRQGLEKAGSLQFRTVSGGESFAADLETFLALEASGWKAKTATAILSNPSTERLYREFARDAGEKGWMRLYVLELDGKAIAADYGCAFAGRGVFIKTGFDEAFSRLSPGLVLRAEVLRSSIEEGLQHYDFLGEADTYKTRWTPQVHPRVRIFAYKGLARPGYLYRKTLRPALKSARERVRRSDGAHE